MGCPVPESSIKTRFLILSDTHAMEFNSHNKPTEYADVAIHCGDLTEESKLTEFHSAIKLLKGINAPLKLVIAGNHDFTLDLPVFRSKVAEVYPPIDPDLVAKEYGQFGQIHRIFEDAKEAGIKLLDEGIYDFVLDNGAKLSIYASPFTPSLGDWGFQYRPGNGHNFLINKPVDIVITHGPPQGILDRTDSAQRAGCPNLFSAVARASPKIHCFGHIHEGWGARLVTWREKLSNQPSYFTDIDNGRSVTIENISSLLPTKHDTIAIVEAKAQKLERLRHQACYKTSYCRGDTMSLDPGVQTLFVNASIQGSHSYPDHLPWLIDIELPHASHS